ncbi:MAG: TetR/AcrR family transcriptional regulator [Bacteroidetes bacterium]|nr:TetR/AcrR family transcriptional regulator [Bacteroidota bacterium]
MSSTDVKSLIVHSATLHFSKYGFHKTTMDEIARHIHKAKGVLYYYFKSKEELFNEVLKQELEVVKNELRQISGSEEDSLTILKKYLLTRLKLLNTAVNYHETIKADFFEKYDFVKDVRDDFARFEKAQLTKIIRKGKKEGYLEIKDIEINVNITMMIFNSVEYPLYLQNKYIEFGDTIEELATIIINSLRTQKSNSQKLT